ncbi:hypothetical protein E2562_013660 [Oryza meyeriana var. granulata]|uniref:Uncharacterized protein n=1 Tax=Oryza meyeriana var. granulata TaxID=110450 RepID=A0A6G1BKC7_9ORYZ|nr:hypothetical protein E2562_013660 [Oryza meyeriana var. granulata]
MEKKNDTSPWSLLEGRTTMAALAGFVDIQLQGGAIVGCRGRPVSLRDHLAREARRAITMAGEVGNVEQRRSSRDEAFTASISSGSSKAIGVEMASIC